MLGLRQPTVKFRQLRLEQRIAGNWHGSIGNCRRRRPSPYAWQTRKRPLAAIRIRDVVGKFPMRQVYQQHLLEKFQG